MNWTLDIFMHATILLLFEKDISHDIPFNLFNKQYFLDLKGFNAPKKKFIFLKTTTAIAFCCCSYFFPTNLVHKIVRYIEITKECFMKWNSWSPNFVLFSNSCQQDWKKCDMYSIRIQQVFLLHFCKILETEMVLPYLTLVHALRPSSSMYKQCIHLKSSISHKSSRLG